MGGNAGRFAIHGLRVDYGSHSPTRHRPEGPRRVAGSPGRRPRGAAASRPDSSGDGGFIFPSVPRPNAVRAARFPSWGGPGRTGERRLFAGRGPSGAARRRAAGLQGAPLVPDTFAELLTEGLGPTMFGSSLPLHRKIWGSSRGEIYQPGRRRVPAGSVQRAARLSRRSPGRRQRNPGGVLLPGTARPHLRGASDGSGGEWRQDSPAHRGQRPGPGETACPGRGHGGSRSWSGTPLVHGSHRAVGANDHTGAPDEVLRAARGAD